MKKLLLFLAATILSLPGWASTRIGDLYYNLYDSSRTAEVTYHRYDDKTNYQYLEGVVSIPETVVYNGITYSVTRIGYEAFKNSKGPTSVTIPNSVTSIGPYAFYGCWMLWIVRIGNSVTSIGDYAFYGCNVLSSVTIPNSVTSIGDYAFCGCSAMDEVKISNSVTEIGDFAFYGCSDLTGVDIPNSVTSIGDYAFYECSGLETVTIPESLTYMGRSPFYTVTGYFSGNLTTVYYNAIDCTFDNVDDDNQAYYTFSPTVQNMIIGEKVKTIPQWFLPNPEVTSIDIPNSVTSIGDYAFYGCSGLSSVTIPNSVTSIGSAAFYGCSGLIGVKISNSVTEIGDAAFGGCPELKNIVVDNGNSAFASIDGILYNKNLDTIICFPAGLAGGFDIPNSVTSIRNDAFYGCIGLTSVTIPNSVTSIGDEAFYGCIGLTSVTIGNSVTKIGNYAFYGCIGLTGVDIPNSVTEIGNYAFNSCSGLETVTIPESLTYMGRLAFYTGTEDFSRNLTTVYYNAIDCTFDNVNDNNQAYYTFSPTVQNVVIGKKVKTIPQWFLRNSEVTSIEIPNSVIEIGSAAFSGCSGLSSVTIPNTVTEIGDYAFRDCSGLTSVTIGSSVTEIGDYAFSGCSGLLSVTIPNSVTEIGDYAFSDCSGLTSLYIGENVSSIGSNAFAESKLLEEIVVAAMNPPTAQKNIFSNYTYPYATLFVPEKSMNSYKTLDPWSNFFTYKDVSESGVDEVGTDASETLYDVFNLNGQLVKRQASQEEIDALTPGIYLIGGKKVVVK